MQNEDKTLPPFPDEISNQVKDCVTKAMIPQRNKRLQCIDDFVDLLYKIEEKNDTITLKEVDDTIIEQSNNHKKDVAFVTIDEYKQSVKVQKNFLYILGIIGIIAIISLSVGIYLINEYGTDDIGLTMVSVFLLLLVLVLFPISYRKAFPFRNTSGIDEIENTNTSIAIYKKRNKYGLFAKKSGTLLTMPCFEDVFRTKFDNFVVVQNGLKGFYGKLGGLILRPSYDDIIVLDEKRLVMKLGEKYAPHFVYSKKRERCIYEKPTEVNDNICIIEDLRGKYIYSWIKGKILYNGRCFDEVEVFHPDYLLVKVGQKFGLIPTNYNGKHIPVYYDKIEWAERGLSIYIWKDGKSKIVDLIK